MIEEIVEEKQEQEPKKVEDIIKRYMESQQELMVQGFLTGKRSLPTSVRIGNDYNLVY